MDRTPDAVEFDVGLYRDPPSRAQLYALLMEHFALCAEMYGFPGEATPEVIDKAYTPAYFPSGWNTGYRTLGWRYEDNSKEGDRDAQNS